MIVADTGAVLALLDADDAHHETFVQLLGEEPGGWILPWAILPEVDFVARSHLGDKVARSFLADLTSGAFPVEWGVPGDLGRARDLVERYQDLKLGLVDAVVIAVAERLGEMYGPGLVSTLMIQDPGTTRGHRRSGPAHRST